MTADILPRSVIAWFPLGGRILIGGLFVFFGVQKVLNFGATVAFSQSVGLPAPEVAVLLAIVIEITAGLLVILGRYMFYAAGALLVFTLTATAFFHTDLADQNQFLFLTKNLMIAGGLLYMMAFGSGAYALGRPTSSPSPEEVA